MKHIFLGLLSVCLLFAVPGCFSSGNNSDTAGSAGSSNQGDQTQPPAPALPPGGVPTCSTGAFLPVSGKIAFFRDSGNNVRDIYTINADGTGETQISTFPGVTNQSPTMDPDGRIAFISDADGDFEIYRIDQDGTNLCKATDNYSVNGSPSLSLDGTKIAYNGAPLSVFISDIDGQNETFVASSNQTGGQNGAPQWCGNNQIAYVSDRTGSGQVFMANPDGTGDRQLTSGGAVFGGVRCCTDTLNVTSIIYTSGGNVVKAEVPASGAATNVTTVTSGSEADFSPDCSRVAFVRITATDYQIWTANADGTNDALLSPGIGTLQGGPSW